MAFGVNQINAAAFTGSCFRPVRNPAIPGFGADKKITRKCACLDVHDAGPDRFHEQSQRA